ncbi:oligosaccharide flippase family protein [Gaetbulibacter aquiaggeris]|uniref:Oligosaccharide flippase family protein n=1 Tax=Gaetbulibacter aquiaggeris TaxID=1735373 RepID=A0ABW7ML58_9FLAO
MQFYKKTTPDLKYFFTGTFYTGLSSIVGLLVPILVVPHLIKTVGLELYGMSAVAFSVSYFFSMIVDYGFNITGVNKLSKESNPDNKTRVINNIIYTKGLIFLTILPICLFIYSFIISNPIELLVYIISLSLPFASVLNLSWALQGLHRIKIWSLLTVFGQFVYLIFIYLFVKDKDDVILINLFYGIGIFVSGLSSLIYIIKNHNFKFNKFIFSSIITELKGSYHFFLSNIGSYTSLYFLGPLVGSLISYEMAGVYSIIEKIYNIGRKPFGIYQTFMLPKISEQVNTSKTVAKRNIKNTYGFVIMFVIIELGALLIFHQEVILYFTSFNSNILESMLLLSLVGILIAIVNCPLALYLTALDRKQELMKIAIIAPLFGLLSGIFLINYFEIIGSIFTLILIEIFYATCLLVVYLNLKGVNFK